MIARPKPRSSSLSFADVLDGRDEDDMTETVDEVRVLPSRVADGLFIECTVSHPSSYRGRNMTLHIPPRYADAMLRALREYNIERRRS